MGTQLKQYSRQLQGGVLSINIKTRMDPKERDEKILQFFKNVFKSYDVNNEGVIPSKQLGSILSALSRPSDEESVGNLVRRFDPDNCGKIAWDNQELLLVIALMDVEDAKKIEDSIFSVGFKTFSKEVDGFLTPAELDIVLRLFLPLQFGQEDMFVSNIVKTMDENNDGKIGFQAFVNGIKNSGD